MLLALFWRSAQIPFDVFLPFFLQATLSLPPLVAQRWCKVVSHHMPIRHKYPDASLGLIDPSGSPSNFLLKMKHLHVNEEAWYVWKQPLMRTLIEGDVACSPITIGFPFVWSFCCQKPHISLWIVSIVHSQLCLNHVFFVFSSKSWDNKFKHHLSCISCKGQIWFPVNIVYI